MPEPPASSRLFRQRARLVRLALAAAALSGCGQQGGTAAGSPAATPATPATPATLGAPGAPGAPGGAATVAAGDVRQSLVEALRPALSRAGSGDDIGARALVAKYLQQPGALEYQAEFVIGYCYQHQKNYTSAKQHFERALAIAPAYYPPWHFIGYADYYLGDLDGARHAFEQHLKSVPDEGESWFGLGITNYDQGRLDDAETDFRKAIERNEAKRAADPSGQSGVREVSKACVRLADVLLARQDLTGAREQLERAAQLFPAQAETWFKLSQVRLRLGDAAGAEQATQKFQQLKTGSP